jgi:hypothetical protein
VTLPDVGDLKEELLVASGRPFVVERDQRTAVRFGDESVWSTTLAADRHVTVATLVAFANAPPLEYYKQRYGRAERPTEFLVQPSPEFVAFMARLDPGVAQMIVVRPAVHADVNWTVRDAADPFLVPRVLIGADGMLTLTTRTRPVVALAMTPDLADRLSEAAELRNRTSVGVYVVAQPTTTVGILARVIAAIQADEWHSVHLSLAAPP